MLAGRARGRLGGSRVQRDERPGPGDGDLVGEWGNAENLVWGYAE